MNQKRSLLEQLRNLEKAQVLDLKIDVVKKNQSGLPLHLEKLNTQLAQLAEVVQVKAMHLEEIEKNQKQIQSARVLNQERMARSQKKLEAVQNSQEFQAATKEMDQLKKLNASLEEQEMKLDLEIEQLRKVQEGIVAEMETLTADRNQKEEETAQHKNQLNQQIDSLMLERDQFADLVEPKILAQYNRVRLARNGIGIVPALTGHCSGCNMVVPPQLFNEIQRGTIVHACPSCHRILFVPADPSALTRSESKSTDPLALS